MMKNILTTSLTATLRLLLAAVLLFLPGVSRGESDIGVIVMAHGGTARWNKTVQRTIREADIPYPTRVFFGMANNREEIEALQDLIHSLEAKGVHTIVVVPLLISSYSEVARQWKYLLGAGIQPGFINNPAFPLERHAAIRFTDPLNDDPVVAEILMEHAQEISQNPEQETVLLAAHGPNDNADNEQWLGMMRHLAVGIAQRGRFKSVEGFTLRDDAAPEVRSQATRLLRERVEAIDRAGGRALVIPLLLAPGGIENKIPVELKGLDYALNAKMLLPDHRISQWVRSRAP